MAISTRDNGILSTDDSVQSLPIATTNISYRFAGMQDIAILSTLAIETYKQTYLPALKYYTDEVLETLFGKSFREKVLPNELKDAKCQYFIFERAAKVAGYAKLEFKADNAYLDKLYLLKEYQGKGYGQKMLQACFQSAVDHGYKSMALHVWAKNEKAIKFYQRNGFKSGAAKLFFLFGKTPTGESNIDMTCADIKPYLDSLSKLK